MTKTEQLSLIERELTKEIAWFGSHMDYFKNATCARHAVERLVTKRDWILDRLRDEDNTLEDGGDYVLEDAQSCWVTIGNGSVHLKHGDDGIGITVYPKGSEMDESVTETWATWAELAFEDE